MMWPFRKRRQPRRSSTRLTAAYTKRETTRLQKCRALFDAGRIGEHFRPVAPAIDGGADVG